MALKSEQEYNKRVRKARAGRDASFFWCSEESYQVRCEALLKLLKRTVKERDAALLALGRLVAKPR